MKRGADEARLGHGRPPVAPAAAEGAAAGGWRSLPRELILPAAAFALILAAAVWLRLRPAELFSTQAIDSARSVLDRLWPPRLEAAVLARAARGVVETFSISVAGTFLGALLGLILMPFCSQSLFVFGSLVEGEERPGLRGVSWGIHLTARLVANLLRTVPYFVWAILFWFMVGLGPFPGALAIAVHSGGVFARLYSSALDQLDPRPLQALHAIGARRSSILVFGMLPAARSALTAYTLYRWEVNIRESAVLGIVGAGGLGFQISYALGTFDWGSLATYLVAVIGLVLAVDAASAQLRRALL